VTSARLIDETGAEAPCICDYQESSVDETSHFVNLKSQFLVSGHRSRAYRISRLENEKESVHLLYGEKLSSRFRAFMAIYAKVNYREKG